MKFSQMPYSRIDMDAVRRAMKDLTERLDRAKSGEEQFQIHQEYYRITDHIMTLMTLAEIRHDIDMTDEFYRQEQDYYDTVQPEIRNLNVEYQKKLYESPYRPYLEEKIGKVAFKNMELAMKSVDEKILPLMQEENKLQTQYNMLLATAEIEWNGETLNLSLMNPYLRNPDRKVRVEAWRKYSEFFTKNREQLDDIYDALVKNRTQQAVAMGGKDYLDLGYARMQRNCYGREDVRSFREQVKRSETAMAARMCVRSGSR